MRAYADTGLPDRLVRLTFRYEDSAVELLDREFYDRRVPPSDEAADPEGESGFWVELRGPQNQLLYRRVMHNPIRHDVEVFGSDGTIRRTPSRRSAGTFIVDVPDLEGESEVLLFSSTLTQIRSGRSAAAPAPAAEVARVGLR